MKIYLVDIIIKMLKDVPKLAAKVKMIYSEL